MPTPTEPTKIATRKTLDGVRISLFSDGTLTTSLGFKIPGCWFRTTDTNRERALSAGWLVLGEAETLNFHDGDELRDFARAARTVADRAHKDKDFAGLPDKARAVFTERQLRALFTPMWSAVSTDGRGNVTERSWLLPRLGQWAGIAVFDSMTGPERLTVNHRVSGTTNTFRFSGVAFSNQLDLFAWLRDNPTTPRDA